MTEIWKHIEADGAFAIYIRGSVCVTVWNLPSMKNRISISTARQYRHHGLTTGRPLGHLIALLEKILEDSKLGKVFILED